MQDISSILKQFGLTPLEIKVYLTLLELGNAPVSTIAKRGRLKRTNLYNILQKLADKGLVSEYAKGSVRFFHITEPHRLIELQEQKKERIEYNIEKLKEIVPILEGIKNPLSLQPKVRFYEGADGIAHLLEQILNNESFDCYFNPEVAYHAYPEIVDAFLENAQKKQFHIRELIAVSKETKPYIRKIRNPNHLYKILPKHCVFSSDNFIFGNKVAFISYVEGSIAVVIESQDIARSQKMAFELMWNAVV